MPRMPRVTATDVLGKLRRDGWTEVPTTGGSHVKLRHPAKPGYVTVATHSGPFIPAGTMAAILKQAGLTINDFRRL